MTIHRTTVSAAFFCIAACSTASPPASEPVAAVVEPATEVTKPVAEVTQPAVSEDSTAGEEGLEVVAVPEVPKVVHNAPPPEVKCRQEKELGSRRIKRVCQTVTEAEQSQAEAEDALKRFQHMKDIQNPGLDL
jgi:membrane-bound lytic murein transglycosylase B